ncbi:hypothetical protein OG21DRAFT_1494931 [Imleria badia]|nr:hypothetical protein OG21DRAFT_1494931 [Imleria badia]
MSSTKGTMLVKKLSEVDTTIITRVGERTTKKGDKMGQIALPWIGQKRLDESIVPEVTLTPEEVAYLKEPYVPKPIVGHF